MRQKIMIIDDNVTMVKQLSHDLRTASFEVRAFLEGESALQELSQWQPELVILDMRLPGMSGYTVCREIRKISGVPVIVLSADDSVADKIAMLELGADDYVTKPFDTGELIARIHAVLRRYLHITVPSDQDSRGNFVSYPDLYISLTNYSVIYDGNEITMPPKELELLYFLASSPNQVFTREQLLDNIWGYDYVGDARTVDVHIKRIRQKIKDHETWSLSTVWGVGYKFLVKF